LVYSGGELKGTGEKTTTFASTRNFYLGEKSGKRDKFEKKGKGYTAQTEQHGGPVGGKKFPQVGAGGALRGPG